MQLSGLDLFLWVAGLVLHLILLTVLWTRHRAGEFPFFTTLIVASVVRTVALVLSRQYGDSHLYFKVFWYLAIADVLFQLGVVYEVASHVFRPTGEWAPGVRRSFFWLVCVSAVVAAGLAWLATPASTLMVQAVVIRGNFFSSMLTSEIFVGLIALSVTMGLPMRTHVARIAQGLGAYSLFCIVTQGLQSYFGVVKGTETYALLSQARIVAYLLCVLYWIVTLWMAAPKPRELPERMLQQLLSLQRRAGLDLDGIRARR